MSPLRRRFGDLVAAHRRRCQLSRADLAAKAELSLDMVNRIERGATGASFETVEKLAAALQVDPAELFGNSRHAVLLGPALQELVARLANLDERQLAWISDVVSAALRRP